MAVPLVCHGHSRPVVDLFYSPVTPDGFFLISASKGTMALAIFHFVGCFFGASRKSIGICFLFVEMYRMLSAFLFFIFAVVNGNTCSVAEFME